jgi:outer membrane protein OmpA-like peptidoglycan-associated protein
MNIKTITIKRTSLVVFMLGFVLLSFSQTAKENKGRKYYGYYDYLNAIEKYEGLTNPSKEVKRELAESYFNTAQYEKAEQYYAEVVAEEKNPDVVYDYVKVLLINQKYEEAEKWMAEFQKLAPNDTRAVLFASNKGFYKEISKNKNYFAVKKLDFNTDLQEFAPSFYKDKIVFTSTKTRWELIKRRWSWNHLPYLDLHVADYDSSSMELKNIEPFGFNKRFHEGTAAFNKAGNFMIMTSNNYKAKSDDKEMMLGMFSSKFVNGKWGKPVPMPFNNKEYSVGHPTLSDDGKTLYFASDMPGGLGNADIYVATKNEDGTWSEPKNLGKEINTEGNEMFPFIHPEGYLFFASDGRPGLGGLDIFVTKLVNGKAGVVQNLMAPVNSNFDDFAFILTDDMKRGYFSSDRVSGKGTDDIYGFDMINPFFASKLLVGTTVDRKDGSLLAGTKVVLYDNTGKVIKQIITKEDGNYSFEINPDKKYTLEGTKTEYNGDKQTIDPAAYQEQVIKTKLELERIPVYNLHFVVLDYDTKEPIMGAKFKGVNKNDPSDKLEFVTNEKGEFFKEIKGEKLNSTLDYAINVSKSKYVASSKDLQIVLDKEGQIEVVEELAKMKVGVDLGKVLNLNPIYFDFNKSNIRPDAAVELDKIVKALNENPTMRIELGSHTDSRGSARSNASLSSRRANSSVKYIRERITNPKRVYGKGYGESKPLVVTKDITEKYPNLKEGSTLTERFINSLKTNEEREDAHQLNRRTEFKIIKF